MFIAASIPIAYLVSSSADAICGVIIILSSFSISSSGPIGSGEVTSSPAPQIVFDLSASYKSYWLWTSPREVFMKIALDFIFPNTSLLNIPFV